MNTTIQQIQRARFEVARSFCEGCANHISCRLQKIQGIKNVKLYPLETMVSFHFNRPNDLSNALNELTQMGYPEKGERISSLETCSFQGCTL